MSNFINYKNGKFTVSTSRLPDASATDVDDIISANEEGRDEILTASLDIWINENLQKIDLSRLSKEEAESVVFGEEDFLERVFEGKLGLSLADYPELRDFQHDFIEDYFA